VAVTPLGLARDALFRLVYRAGAERSFGKSLALRCPHYLEDGGRCGIWRHREATCITWFCKHVRGAVGRMFWHNLKLLLATIEDSLACWCVQHLEVGSEALRLLFAPTSAPAEGQALDRYQVDGAVDPAYYRAIWGDWAGREQDFYRASASLVNALTWEDIEVICGPELPIRLRLTREAYQALRSETLPPLLQVRPWKELTLARGACQVVTYSPYDPLRLKSALVGVLPAFDGRPLEQVRQTLAREEQIELDDAFIRKLVDFELLAAPAESQPERYRGETHEEETACEHQAPATTESAQAVGRSAHRCAVAASGGRDHLSGSAGHDPAAGIR
jgi:hypothetical protein